MNKFTLSYNNEQIILLVVSYVNIWLYLQYRIQIIEMYMKQAAALFLLFISMHVVHAMDSTKVARMPEYRYYINVATFFPNSETNIRVDGNFFGTYINAENDLKLKGKGITFRAEAFAQLSPRSSLALTYFSIFRNGGGTLDRDITYNDSTFHIGAHYNTYFNIRFMGASYRYSIFYNKTWSLGLTAGLRVLNVDAGLSVQANNYAYSGSFSTYIPVALFGIHGSAYITPKFLARYSFEYFGLTIADIGGRVIDNRLMLEYYIVKNFCLGGSFTNIRYGVTNFPISSNFDGNINYNITGFSLYAGVRF